MLSALRVSLWQIVSASMGLQRRCKVLGTAWELAVVVQWTQLVPVILVSVMWLVRHKVTHAWLEVGDSPCLYPHACLLSAWVDGFF